MRNGGIALVYRFVNRFRLAVSASCRRHMVVVPDCMPVVSFRYFLSSLFNVAINLANYGSESATGYAT